MLPLGISLGAIVPSESDGICRISLQRVDGALCRAGLLLEDLAGTLAHWRASSGLVQQIDENPGEFFFGRNPDGVVRAQVFGDGAEVGVVRSHHDGHAELCRLQRIVAAGRDEASAHERHACK